MAKKVKNLRDLGGIRAADGMRVRPGLLYRSGHLAHLKPRHANHMRDKLGIKSIIDLRAPSELAQKSDVVAESVEYCHLPPLNDEQNPAVNRHNCRTLLNNIMSHKGGAREHMSDTYRTMVTEEPSLEAFATLIHMLLEENDGAFLWHCTQGKDRTGIASAAVLLALGVDRDEIMRDYMRTNKSCRVKNFFIYLGVILVTLSRRSAWSLHQILISRREYLKAAFEKMDELYGGTEGFLTDGLGLSQDDIFNLRKIYLE